VRPVRRAAILSVGDELITGQTLDTNSAWLSAALVEHGVLTVEHRTVSDDRAAISEALRSMADTADLVLISGGLGPTLDDLTREALGDVVTPGTPLVEDAVALAELDRLFRRRSRDMPVSNRRQALHPQTAALLPNRNGTAPGILAHLKDCMIIALPGPPRELQPMFREHVLPRLGAGDGQRAIRTGMVRLAGLGESAAAERLGDLMHRGRNPMVGTTVSGGMVAARVRAEGPPQEAEHMLEADLREIERRWSPYAFGRGESLAEAVASLCVQRSLRVASAESCSGGLLAASIVEVPGASRFFLGGWVTYSNAMKVAQLNVEPAVLESVGAVSAQTATQMAVGAIDRSGADYALSITGIAGPDGGTAAKPVGTVHIGLARRERAEVIASSRCFVISGARADIRERSVSTALQWLRLTLLGHSDTPLLWEVGPSAR
jgi:nicotinamide-nucleotide amidase